MKRTAAKQYVKIHPHLPVQRGNVKISNTAFINAILFVMENGCKWRALQTDGGDVEFFGLDSDSAEVHPDGTGARKASGPRSIGKSRGGWCAKIHMISASDCPGVIFRLSGGQAHDAPEGRALLESWDKKPIENAPLAIGPRLRRRQDPPTCGEPGMTPVVPPKANRKAEWDYDWEPCKPRNEIERLFRRLKGCWRICTRFDKLDVMFSALEPRPHRRNDI